MSGKPPNQPNSKQEKTIQVGFFKDVSGKAKLPVPSNPMVLSLRKLSELSDEDYGKNLGIVKEVFNIESVKLFLKQEISNMSSELERKKFVDELFYETDYEVSIKLKEKKEPDIFNIPTKAPVLWVERDKTLHQTPLEFIKANYKIWLDGGLLSRPYLRRVDPPLYMALYHWLKTNPLPEGVNLPSKADLNDRDLKRAGREGIREARRLVGLAYKS